MRVVVYGVGKVGTKIAETLYDEGHDITVIDVDEVKVNLIQKSLDVLAFAGHIGEQETVNGSGMKGADVFIAVTESDEENLIASIIAKKLEIQRTIARIRNPAYLNKVLLDTSEIGVDHVINPEREVAYEILKLIRSPWASEVDTFMNGRVVLVEAKVNQENIKHLNEKIKEVCKTNNIIVVESSQVKSLRFYEPSQDIQLGDHLFFLEKKTDVGRVNKIFEDVYKKIEHVVIAGGGVTGSELLNLLKDTDIRVKLIEKRKKICNILSEKWKESLILHGDATDYQLLLSENIQKSDCFVAVTGDNEVNIMSSLLAKQMGVKRAITRISKDYEEEIMAGIGLDAAVNLNRVTANKILHFVRRENLVSLSLLDEELQILEFNTSAKARISKKSLREAQFVKGAIIGAVLRRGGIFFPKENFVIKEGDSVLVFLHKGAAPQVEKYFA